MLGANGCYACVGGFAGFGERVVTGVEIFAFLGSILIRCVLGFPRAYLDQDWYLQLVLQQILLVW